MVKASNANNFSIFFAALTSFTFGLSLTTFDILRTTLLQTLSQQQLDQAIAFFCLGALLSNLAINHFNITVKMKIIVSELCYVLGTALLFKYNFYVVMLGRFTIGLGTGIVCCIIPFYLSSLATVDNKGFVGCLHQLNIVCGLLLGQIMSWFYDGKDVKLPFVLIIAFCIIVMAGLCFIKDLPIRNEKRKGMLDLIKNRKATKSIFVGLIFHIGQQLSCINGIVFYSSVILSSYPDPKLKTIYIGIVSLASSILALFVVDRAGRKFMFLLSCLICAFSLGMIAYNYYVVSMILLYTLGFNIGLGPVSWLVIGEIYDEEYKSAGIELAVGANWISNYCILLLFGFLFEKMKLKAFVVFAGATIVVMGLIAWLFQETKGRPAGFLK